MNTSAPRVGKLGLLLLVLAPLAAWLSGCACLSAGDYQGQCCSACCTVCTDGCVPLCVDTLQGRGPLGGGSSATVEVAAPAVPSAPTAVAY